MLETKRLFLITKNNLLFFLFFINSIIIEGHEIDKNEYFYTTNLLEGITNFTKTDSTIKIPEILAGTTKICVGTSTELKVTNTFNGDIIWKNSSNEVIGNGSVLKISPKRTTSYYAVFKLGKRESEPSNKITISVSLPSFIGTPTVPADYKVTSSEPFYLGSKEAEGVQLRWKHERNTGGITLITPTITPTNYYVRYEEPKTGCVSEWKAVSVSLDKSKGAANILSSKNFKPLANTPATSCAALSTSSDAQLCSGTSFAALVGNTTNGGTASTQWGCLGTRPNQSWFYFIPLTSGSVSFTVTNTSNVDVDGAIWGPVNTVADACLATQSAPLTCDYSGSANIALSISSVTAGKVYVLVVTNYIIK